MTPMQIDRDLARLLSLPLVAGHDAADDASLTWGPAQHGDWALRLHRYPAPNVLVLVVDGPGEVFDAVNTHALDAVPGSADPAPMIGRDWAQLSEELLELEPGDRAPGAGRKLQSFLYGLGRRGSLFVTGAGMAAGVAQVLAVWAKETFPSMWVGSRTFVAPAVGTPDFASYAELTLDEMIDWSPQLRDEGEALYVYAGRRAVVDNESLFAGLRGIAS